MDAKLKSFDKASQQVLKKAALQGVETAWDRFEAQQPQCRFGQQGICCRICSMGPCRPKGDKCGVCGANADTIVARNLVRMIAAGTAAHSDHGRDVTTTLLAMARGEAKDYYIKSEQKLRALAEEYGLKADGKSPQKLAEEVGMIALNEFGKQEGTQLFLKRAPKRRQEIWDKLGLAPRGIDREVVEIMHRTTMGVDNDFRNIIKQGMRAALADGWGGSMIATDLQDILLGSPQPIRAKVNLGVLKEDQVNIVIHGHEPLLSDMIVEASLDPELIALAKSKGAKGISLSGICCTSAEVLMRRGIPCAGNFLQQELAIATGAVDAMVVDVQCVMASLPKVAACFHTKLITTSSKARIPGVEHIEFDEHRALEVAKQIVRVGVENYSNRAPEMVDIPKETMDLVAGFTAEYVFRLLGGTFRPSYRPLNNGLIEGRLRGVVGVVGCTNPRYVADSCHIDLVKELIRNDVLVVQTGCSATACGKEGLLRPEAAKEFAGRGLQEICEAVGIPPVLHVGSCVDNSRILIACCDMLAEGGLGEDISDLPVAAAAPEWMSEKAVAIGFYAVASGIFTVFGHPLPISGSEQLSEYLTSGIEKEVGGKWAFEADPLKQAELIIAHLNRKRDALKLKPMLYEAEKGEPVPA